MQGHRLLRAVAVLVLILALVYLLLALGGAIWLGGSGFGSGWGTGWTGWLVIPLAAGAIMAGLSLMVFGIMLFFLAKIDDNLAEVRRYPRALRKPKLAAAEPAVAPSIFAQPRPFEAPSVGVAGAGVAGTTAIEPVAPPAAESITVTPEEAPLVEPVPTATYEDTVEETPLVETIPTAAYEGAVEETLLVEPVPTAIDEATVDEASLVEAAPTATYEATADEALHAETAELPAVDVLPPAIPELQVEAAEPGRAVLPSVEVTEVDQSLAPLEATPAQADVPASVPVVELPSTDLPMPEIGATLLEATFPEEETAGAETKLASAEFSLTEPEPLNVVAEEVELPRVDVGDEEAELEITDMKGPVPTEEALQPETVLPEIEISDVSDAERQQEISALSEATGVPEPEFNSGVTAEPAAGSRTFVSDASGLVAPAKEDQSEVAALRSEVESLRELLAGLRAELTQPKAPSGSQGAALVGGGSTTALSDSPEVTEELPDEPPPAASESSAGAAPAKLPGAGEVARIAAEMDAIKQKRSQMPPVAPSSARPAAGGQDNLEIIMGVGPIYAKRLRELGITTYQQLADASYEVLDKVTRGNLERVVQEDWRGQARRLMNRE